MDYRNFIKNSLEKASIIAHKNFGKVKGTSKGNDNNQVLTKTDLDIGHLLIKEIEVNFPDYNIIDEEAGIINKSSKYTWVTDPIDGTSNFANAIPMYGIFLGLLENDKPIASGMSIPSFGKIYVAQKGKGCFCNGKKILLPNDKELLQSLVAYGVDGHQENPKQTIKEVKILAKIILGIRNLRSSNSAYDFSVLLDGGYGAFLNQTSKIWDNVAAQVLVEEAGGVYTDFFGKAIDYSNPLSKADKNFTYCAASPKLHRELQKTIYS